MHAYQDSEVASPLFHSHRKLELPMKLGRETSIKTDMHRVVGMQMNFNPLQFADGGGVDNTRPSNKLYTQIETLEQEKTDLMKRLCTVYTTYNYCERFFNFLANL